MSVEVKSAVSGELLHSFPVASVRSLAGLAEAVQVTSGLGRHQQRFFFDSAELCDDTMFMHLLEGVPANGVVSITLVKMDGLAWYPQGKYVHNNKDVLWIERVSSCFPDGDGGGDPGPSSCQICFLDGTVENTVWHEGWNLAQAFGFKEFTREKHENFCGSVWKEMKTTVALAPEDPGAEDWEKYDDNYLGPMIHMEAKTVLTRKGKYKELPAKSYPSSYIREFGWRRRSDCERESDGQLSTERIAPDTSEYLVACPVCEGTALLLDDPCPLCQDK